MTFIYKNDKMVKEVRRWLKCYLDSIGAESLFLSGDIKDKNFCSYIVEETLKKFGKIDILINNAAVQYQKKSLLDITDEQFDFTMKTNVYSMFYLTKFVLKCKIIEILFHVEQMLSCHFIWL